MADSDNEVEGAEMSQEVPLTDSCSSLTSSSSKAGLEPRSWSHEQLTPTVTDSDCGKSDGHGDVHECTSDQTTENETINTLDPVDVLFQRIVRERSLELSNLQIAMRPVTGSSIRDNLAQHLDRRTINSEINPLSSDPTDALFQRIISERNLELSNIQNGTRPVTGSSTIDNLNRFFSRASDQRRNEGRNASGNMREDVQGLLQRNLVTSALRRSAFRSRLEGCLSSSLGGVSLAASPIVSYLNRPRRSSLPSGTSTPPVANIPDDVDTASIASSDTGSEILQLQRFVRAGVDLLSETIQDDIQQLHHLHIVNSALESEFRSELERLVESRVSQVGGGAAVQQFIHSLPPATRPTQPSAAPARQRPVHQGTSAIAGSMTLSDRINVTGEIESMKKQVEEMKQMLQISFELQMDTQRAIRQEVSAVFGAFMQQWLATQEGTSSGGSQVACPTQSAPRPTPPVSAGSCVICLDSNIDSVLYQCGHMCVCHGCGIRLRTQGHNCPLCRAPIREVIRAYQSQ